MSKKSSTKSNSKKGKSSKSGGNRRSPASSDWESARRIILAVILVLLAAFSILGWFNRDAAILSLLYHLECGLFGTGVYFIPLVLCYLAFFLAFRDMSSLVGRIVSIALIPLEFGASVFLFRYPEELWETEQVKGLWMAGIEGKTGGFLTGCFGGALRWCLSTVGAAIILLLMLLWSGMALFGLTPVKMFMAVRKAMPGESEESREERLAKKAAERKAETKRKREESRQLTMEQLASRYAGGSESNSVEERMDVRVSRLKSPIVVEEILPEDPAEEISDLENALFTRPSVEIAKEQSLDNDILEFNARRNSFIIPDSDFDIPAKNDVTETWDEELITDKIRKNAAIQKSNTKDSREFVKESEDFERTLEYDETESQQDFFDDMLADKVDEKPHDDTVSEELSLDMNPEFPPIEEAEVPAEGQEKDDEAPPSEEKKNNAVVEQEKTVPSLAAEEDLHVYHFPPVDLLKSPEQSDDSSVGELQDNRERLSEALLSFGVEPNIVDIVRGPTVTRYELKLSPGVKLSKITGLADDIALALGASGVRIAAIQEKISVVGIEVPNKTVSTVYLREVIESSEFSSSKSTISFAVGKDIGGNRIISNIAKLPHLLIAGTTGSGKSVCMNCLITSLLYKASPEDVKLIMIDPKMVELGVYNGIPHLMIPVVTDPKKASGSLQWAVSEMLRRYSIMAESGARDLSSYNRIIENNPERNKIPQLIVVIDELADLMMAAAKEVEESICRIAQMGRAAGVHLVIATQRPSANVITGLMKANIPSRIAFAVSSAMESRIILDAGGAEKLVGRGDMLYAPLGEGKAKRIQGCYVSDEEVLRVTTFVKAGKTVVYDSRIEKEIEEKAKGAGKQQTVSSIQEDEEYDDTERDEMLYDAVDVFMDMEQASVSVLQRKLKVGYARASRIVDQMEEMGIVGPHKGSKPRDMLISKEKWQAVKDGLMELEEALSAE